MNSFFKYVTLCALAAASLGIVACNNGTRSLKASVPADNPSSPTATPPGEPAPEVNNCEWLSPDFTKENYGFKIIRRGNTNIDLSGQLARTAIDAQRFSTGGTDYAYVVREKTSGCTYRDFMFYFPWGATGAALTPQLYISHQNTPGYFYHSQVQLPILSDMATQLSTSEDALMKHLGRFLGGKNPMFDEFGEDNDLSLNVISEWISQANQDFSFQP